MLTKIFLLQTFFYAGSLVQAGFSGFQLAYRTGLSSPLPSVYSSSFAPPYAGPLPVAPARAAFAHNTLTYSLPPSFVKLPASGGFDCGPLLRSRPKFAFPAPVPAVYDAPLPVDVGPSDANYDAWEVPNIVVKFGPPITTTTTTTYLTSAAAAAGVHGSTASVKAANGW